ERRRFEHPDRLAAGEQARAAPGPVLHRGPRPTREIPTLRPAPPALARLGKRSASDAARAATVLKSRFLEPRPDNLSLTSLYDPHVGTNQSRNCVSGPYCHISLSRQEVMKTVTVTCLQPRPAAEPLLTACWMLATTILSG